MKSRYIFSLNIPSIYLLRNKSKKKAVSISARLWVYLSLWVDTGKNQNIEPEGWAS